MAGPLQPLHDALGPTLFYFAASPLLKIVVLLFAGVLPLISYLVLAERKALSASGDSARHGAAKDQ